MLFRQPGWRTCHKCREIFLGPLAVGVCPVDGRHHDPTSSSSFVVLDESASVRVPGYVYAETVGLERGWAHCHLCGSMYFGTGAALACPAGPRHEASADGEYWAHFSSDYLHFEVAGYQLGWARCSHCSVMFSTAGAHSTCPGNHGAGHVMLGTHNYALLLASPLDDAGEAHLLVVAPTSLTAAVQPLVAHRNATGTLTRMVSLADCLGHFGGSDDAARLRVAIVYASEYLETRYVLLVGDASMIPVRYRYIAWDDVPPGPYYRRGTYCPTDLYYANLYSAHVFHPDGTVTHGPWSSWDADGDARYDEQLSGDPSLENPDQVDGFVDLAVGRLPTSDPTEVSRYVAKLLAFERGSARDFDLTVGVIADALYGDTIPDVARFSELADLLGPAWPAVEKVWFPGPPPYVPTPPGYRTAAPDETIAATVARSAWVAYLGHGGYSEWDVAGSDRASVATQQATNVPVVVAMGCATGQLANFAPDGPGGYVDVSGVRHLYGFTDNTNTVFADWGDGDPLSDPPVQTWVLAETGAIDPATPSVYQPTLDRPTVAAQWLHAQESGGAVAYFGEQTVASDSPGAELIGRMMGAAIAPGGQGQVLGDLWIVACKEYWVAFHASPDGIANARIYLSYMTLYGDPCLRL
jgi:Peptidase family C25